MQYDGISSGLFRQPQWWVLSLGVATLDKWCRILEYRWHGKGRQINNAKIFGQCASGGWEQRTSTVFTRDNPVVL